MKILVTGATGRVGGEVVKALLQRRADVRALARKQPKPGTFPDAVEIALGDLTDPVSIAEALKNVDKVFLLIAGVADGLIQALIAYGLSKKAGLKHVTSQSLRPISFSRFRISLRCMPSRKQFVQVECLIRFCGPHTFFRMSAD